jgi:hypothetical protein
MPCLCFSASSIVCFRLAFACRTVSPWTESTPQMRCITAARHLSKKVRALLLRACICIVSTSRCRCSMPFCSATGVSFCGSSKLIRSWVGGFGVGSGLVAVEDFVSVVLIGSKVARRSLRMESMQSSTNRANSTRWAGVSRTELSEAPSCLVVSSAPAPDKAPATLENILRV